MVAYILIKHIHWCPFLRNKSNLDQVFNIHLVIVFSKLCYMNPWVEHQPRYQQVVAKVWHVTQIVSIYFIYPYKLTKKVSLQVHEKIETQTLALNHI